MAKLQKNKQTFCRTLANIDFHVLKNYRSIDNIIINTIAPVLYAYGLYHKNEPARMKALDWLEQLASESNAIISGFKNLSIPIKNAYDSQSLLELKNEYCSAKRCLSCAVGNAILKNS